MNGGFPEHFCRKCMDDFDGSGDLAEIIQSYIRSLDTGRRTPPEEYARRLRLCAGCGSLLGITCSLCGCFVPVRAAKKNLHCPDADSPKW